MENIKMNNMKEQQTNEKVIVVYQINEDNYEEYIGKTVKVAGNVNLSNLGLRKIPINFTTVGGGFYCHNNKLPSLKGAPEKVGGTFDCHNNGLTSLKGGPEKVGGAFDCSHNKLTSLEGCPKEIDGTFDYSYNKLASVEG